MSKSINGQMVEFFNKTIKPVLPKIGTPEEQARHVAETLKRFSLANVSKLKNMREPATQSIRDVVYDIKLKIPPGEFRNKKIKQAVDFYRASTKPILDAEMAIKNQTNPTIQYIINKEINLGNNILRFPGR